MGSENSEQSDETIEAQERFQEFGIGSDPSEARNFVSPIIPKLGMPEKSSNEDFRQGYVEKQQETYQNLLKGFQPSARQVQEFAREQQNIDELGYNPTVEGQDIPGVSVSENINVGPYDVFGLEKQIADQLALGNRPVYSPDGSIGGVMSRAQDTKPFGLLPTVMQNLFPEGQVYTGIADLDPNRQVEDQFTRDNDEPLRILPRNQTVAQVEETAPVVSDDLALNYLQNPYYLYSGMDNLYQPYGYGQGTLVDLLKTRNLTQPTSAAPNLNLFANPRDFA